MRYVSTRGGEGASFEEALLRGLAPDGGLYVPETWPRLSANQLRALKGRPYTEVAGEVIAPFAGDTFSRKILDKIIAEAYGSFSTALVAPLTQIGPNDFLMELFHGPTLAFKDVALQLLSRLFEISLAKSGEKLTIVVATSGDTGSAAIEAIRGREGMEIFVLFPHGRVSDVQRRQMTTASEENVHVLAVDGTFDDCQRMVKELFADAEFVRTVSLSGVNSINWARIMAQTVYYVTAALALGAPEREVSFVVPSGNFGDIYAGYVAARMGLPVKRLIAATNINDILARTLATGRYEKRGVTATSSPSMDIEVASNFERLVFEAVGRDVGTTRALFASLVQSGAFTLPEKARGDIGAVFSGARATETQVAEAIAKIYREAGQLIDPHTAVGVSALGQARASGVLSPADCAVVLSTAHPAKFPEAVEKAAGVRPALPPGLMRKMSDPERLTRIAADTGAAKVEILNSLHR